MNGEIAQKYDALRKSIPKVSSPNLLVITSGVNALSIEAVADILTSVKEFDSFNEDNDPYGEHDFGAFDYEGQKIFWKIDNHNGQEGYNLVLTVMLAEEY